MAIYFGQIDSYFINMLSPKTYQSQRLMNLNGKFGKAIVWFIPESIALPDNKKRSGQNVFDVYYRVSDWAAVVDLLRNEKPVFFNFNDANNSVQIYTGSEPVGEEE